MVALLYWTDALLVQIDQSYSGQNWKDNRSIWHGLDDITFETGDVGGTWFADAGSLSLAADVVEPRSFCVKGQFTINFTGRTLLIRLNLAFSWFNAATVTIDGVTPSTLGLLSSVDTLSCDAADIGWSTEGYHDFIVADGLDDTAHTCVVVIDNSDPTKFFSVAGFKIGTRNSLPITRSGVWIVPNNDEHLPMLSQNAVTYTLRNQGAGILNAAFRLDDGMVDDTGLVPDMDLTASFVPSYGTLTRTIYPAFTGTEISGNKTFNVELQGRYRDLDGSITDFEPVTALVGDPAFTVTGSWFTDTSTPDGRERIFTTGFTSTGIALVFVGDTLAIEYQTSGGWGELGVYAADNTTLLHSVNCDDDTGGAVTSASWSGFGAGTHTVHLRKTTADSKFIVLVSAQWGIEYQYTDVTETVTMVYETQQPYASHADDVVVSSRSDVQFAPPLPAIVKDYSGTPVRDNADVKYSETLSRFPTYAVCYQGGFRDILAQYDRLILDPVAAHTADVKYWQSIGIECYFYIASGEEVGYHSDRYDLSSPLSPNRGDGLGPGGWASYYMYTANSDPVTGFPDQDGAWSSYYLDVRNPLWLDRIESWYMPQCVGGPEVVVDEIVTTKQVHITAGDVIVFDTAKSPIDIDETISLRTLGGHHYTTYSDFSFDYKTGAFILSGGISPAVTPGQQLKVSYTRKGHRGHVFYDVMDTPDVYLSNEFGYQYVPGYKEAYIAYINQVKADFPSTKFISNRGFTILPDVVQSMSGVMFESWLTTPINFADLFGTDYKIITDPGAIAYNNGVLDELNELRRTHKFDVYSLNYAKDTTMDEVEGNLKAYCRRRDAAQGFLSWQSLIALNKPGANTVIPNIPVSNAYTRVKVKPL